MIRGQHENRIQNIEQTLKQQAVGILDCTFDVYSLSRRISDLEARNRSICPQTLESSSFEFYHSHIATATVLSDTNLPNRPREPEIPNEKTLESAGTETLNLCSTSRQNVNGACDSQRTVTLEADNLVDCGFPEAERGELSFAESGCNGNAIQSMSHSEIVEPSPDAITFDINSRLLEQTLMCIMDLSKAGMFQTRISMPLLARLRCESSEEAMNLIFFADFLQVHYVQGNAQRRLIGNFFSD